MFIEVLKPKKQYTIVHTLCTALVCVFFSLPIVSDTAGANTPLYQVIIDEQTQQKGFTVSAFQDQIKLGIMPKTFPSQQIVVDVKDVTKEGIPLPINKTLVSPIFLYDLVNAPQKPLETPLVVSLQYTQADERPKNLYYWDKGKLSWQKLPTILDENTFSARTHSPFPFNIVAVFAEEVVFTQEMQKALDQQIQAQSIAIINPIDDSVLYQKNVDEKRSIASISKLMTALVFLDHNPGWSTSVTMKKTDEVGGARLSIKVGESITVKDLFYATLIGSKNNAATALARSTGLSKEDFVKRMNEKALELGMQQTSFVEPTGLSSENTSTALDIAKLTKIALEHPLISQVSTQTDYAFATVNTKRKIYVQTTNQLLYENYGILGGKTGYTPEAQYCLTTELELNGGNVIAVVLGAPEKNTHFQDMKTIFDELIKKNQ